MEEIEQKNGEDRKSFMLRVAAVYIALHWPEGLVMYDGAECDGYCVADDCLSAAEFNT